MAANLFQGAAPEFHLVAACCRWPGEADRARAVESALQQSLHWPSVVALAQRHRVSGLVSHALAGRQQVPAEIRQVLAKAQQSILLANMAALRAQVGLAKLFQKNGIPFAILKGTPLAVQAYGGLALRQSRDIDLLVHEADIDRTDALLQAAGYRRTGLSATLTDAQQQLWRRFRKHYEYVAGENGTRLELHWRTTDNHYLAGAADVLARREEVPVSSGIDLPVLPREELLLDLCTHGAGHAWFRLKWIADVNALLHASGEAGQKQLLRTARQHGLERPVLQALHLCSALFALPLGDEEARISVPVRQLFSIAEGALLQEDVSSPAAASDFVPRHQTLSHMLLRRDWGYRLEELRLNLACPADWQRLHLPPHVHLLYPLLRLPLWVYRRWAGPAVAHSPKETRQT